MWSKAIVLSVLCVSCLVAVTSALHHHASQPSEQKQFTDFVKKFNKKYSTLEMFSRFNKFRQNLKLIAAHNARFAAGEVSFTVGVNALADLSEEEYRATRLGFKPLRSDAADAGVFTGEHVRAIPSAVDLRTKGMVNSVKDQGQCGSCWSFSATAALECTDFLHTDKLKSFSEQMCVDCVDDGACNCTVGGEMHDCMVLVHDQGGEMLESDYPYTGTSEGVCHFDKSKATGTFGNYVNVTQYNETALKVASVSQVISVGIDASSWLFQLYSGGVYDDSSCKWQIDELDHGVAVVGYGHDSSSDKDYWIVRNSWGSSWGESGYIRMVRNKSNQCGIATDATFVPA
jgi:cathepsin L